MDKLNLLIGVACTVIGTCLGVYSAVLYARNEKQEDLKDKNKATNDLKQEVKADVACNTRMEVKLDYVSKGVDDIKLDHKDMGRQLISISDRLIVVEESAKSAHKRLDKLEGVK